MIAILFVLGLIVLLTIVNPPRHRRRYPSGPPPGWEPPEEREARCRLEALIASYPARHREFMESQRPVALAVAFERDELLLQWPDGRLEWTSRVEIAAKDIHPTVRR